MPIATVSAEPDRYDLKSLPEGYVMLRHMSHGEMLHRQDLSMQMQMQADRRTKSASMEVKQMQTAVVQYEFSVCIISHNLQAADGRTLDLRNPLDFASLDGRIGAEIATEIDRMHDWEGTLPNSETRSTSLSSALEKAEESGKPVVTSSVS
jgi:hypothetical protein